MSLRINFVLSKMKHNIDSSSVNWSLKYWYKEKTILFQENKRQAIDLRQ